MGGITVNGVSKAYKTYRSQWLRLLEWFSPNSKSFHQKKWVLLNINFAITPGESVGIMGINGAGKSTLLKLITGTIKPTTGLVETSGRVAALLELGLGFHPYFTGRENVFMAGQLLGLAREDISRLMPEIESFAEIGGYIDQPVRIYSSGMQVRLAFSVATAVRPDILIVDEALSVGDAYFQAKCYQRINSFKKEGTTLLLVSHSPGEVTKHCERALLIKNGHVISDGPSRDVSNQYLDELFGKKTSPADHTSAKSTPSVADELMASSGDVFHTRLGYRKEEHRWGHGGAVIQDYLIVSEGAQYPSRIEGNSQTQFLFKVKFERDFENVVPGFLIKTHDGIFLYGTNSFVSTREIGSLPVQAGQTCVFKFEMPMSLNEGHYLVSFGISSGSPLTEMEPLDRRYDAVLVHVGRTLPFWGIVDLRAQYEITRTI